MKWKEMTIVQKIISVIGWICVLADILLSVLDLWGPLEGMDALCKWLFAVWCLSLACTQKNRRMKILWYVLSAAYLLLGVLWLFP